MSWATIIMAASAAGFVVSIIGAAWVLWTMHRDFGGG